jgi:hypothetical protein
MSRSQASQERSNRSSPSDPLPLFRPEALVAPEKFYGDVLLIRPFPVAMLVWVALGITGALLSFLVSARYEDSARTYGVVVEPVLEAPLGDLQVEIPVTTRWLLGLRPGRPAAIRCPSCADPSAWIAATILQVVPSPIASQSDKNHHNARISLTVSSRPGAQDARQMQPGTRVEFAMPFDQRPLLHWMLERPQH